MWTLPVAVVLLGAVSAAQTSWDRFRGLGRRERRDFLVARHARRQSVELSVDSRPLVLSVGDEAVQSAVVAPLDATQAPSHTARRKWKPPFMRRRTKTTITPMTTQMTTTTPISTTIHSVNVLHSSVKFRGTEVSPTTTHIYNSNPSTTLNKYHTETSSVTGNNLYSFDIYDDILTDENQDEGSGYTVENIHDSPTSSIIFKPTTNNTVLTESANTSPNPAKLPVNPMPSSLSLLDYQEELKKKRPILSIGENLDSSFYAYDEYDLRRPEATEQIGRPDVALSSEEVARLMRRDELSTLLPSSTTAPTPATLSFHKPHASRVYPDPVTPEPLPQVDVFQFINNLFSMIRDEAPSHQSSHQPSVSVGKPIGDFISNFQSTLGLLNDNAGLESIFHIFTNPQKMSRLIGSSISEKDRETAFPLVLPSHDALRAGAHESITDRVPRIDEDSKELLPVDTPPPPEDPFYAIYN